MECRIYTESLTALMDGELPGEEAGAIRAHLLVCPSCDAEYRSLLFSYELVSKTRLIESRPAAWTVIESRIRAPQESRTVLRSLFFPNIWLPIAAIAGLILFTSFVFLFVPSDSHSVAMRQVLENYIQERDRDLVSKGVLTSGVGSVRTVHYNPFRDAKSKPKSNPFRAE
ncbi:MAG: zf-HC2 domain-containing protein [Acidobacteriota bacterium]